MESTRFLFYSQDEIAAQEEFEIDLRQMEEEAWAEFQRKLDAALSEFLADKNSSLFHQRHAAAEVEYQEHRAEWWKKRR